MYKRLKTDIGQHIRQNFVLYIIIVFAIITGFTSGTFTAGSMTESQKSGLSEYMEQFFSLLGSEPVKRGTIFWDSLWQHFKVIFLIYICGLFIIGIPFIIFLAGTRGFLLGFTIGFIVGQYGLGGFLFMLICILPQALIYLTCYIGISVMAFELSLKKLKNRHISVNREQRLKKLTPYTGKILIFLLIVLFSCVIEAFVTPLFFGLFKFVFI